MQGAERSRSSYRTGAALAVAALLLLVGIVAGADRAPTVGPAPSLAAHPGSQGPSSPSLRAFARPSPAPPLANLTLNPSNGTVGSTVEAMGTGFPHDVPVNLTWDAANVLAQLETDSNGTLTCDFTVPSAPAGPHTLTLSASRGVTASATFGVNASIVLSPPSGGAGTLVSLNGSGFAADSNWTVEWSGTPGILCTGPYSQTSPLGAFACSFVVPTITPATYTVRANDSAIPQNNATALFTLPFASLLLSPSSGTVGTVVTATGSGFVGSTGAVTFAVALLWGPGGWVLCNPSTDASGDFACSFSVPDDVGGAHTLRASDPLGNRGTSTFTVLPSFELDPAAAPAGAMVAASGWGFAPLASAKVTWAPGGGTLCTATTNQSGAFGCAFVVPSDPTGSYEVTGTAILSASADFTLDGAFPTVAVAFTTVFAVSTYMPLNLSLAWTITASQPVNVTTTTMWLNVSDEGSSACPYILYPTYPPYSSIVEPPCLVVSIPLDSLLVNGMDAYSTTLTLATLTSAGYNGGVLPYDTEYLLQVFVAMTNSGSRTVAGAQEGVHLLTHAPAAALVAPTPRAGVPAGNVTVAVSYTGDFVSGASVEIFTASPPVTLVFSSLVAVPGSGPRIGVAGVPWEAAVPGNYEVVINLTGAWGYQTFTTALTVFSSGGGTVYVNQSTYQNNSLIPGWSNGVTGSVLLLVGAIIGLLVALVLARMMWSESRPAPARAWKGQPNECRVCHQRFDNAAALSAHMDKAHGL